MHCRLAGPFFLMGVSFTVLQTLMVRELLVSFSGNELSIGLVLGSWLVLEALGSGLAGHLSRRIPPHPDSYAWLQLILSLLLLPSLLAALHVRSLVGAIPGEVIAPWSAFLSSLLFLAPLGLVDGAMFTTACRVELRPDRGAALAPGLIYALEAAGSIAGGVVLTYLLLPWLTSTQILLVVAALNSLSASYLFWLPPRRSCWGTLASGLLALVALVGLVSPLGTSLHRWAVAGRWAPYRVVFEGNSDYGNVAVTQSYDQITLFANGVPVLSAPDPDIATAELLVHLPVLFLGHSPRRVLVIGGGTGGLLREVLRYPLEQVDYAEPDPLLVQALREVPTPLTEAELSNPRLHLALEDGRRFVQRGLGEQDSLYDMILLNLPYPSTLVLNRFYTQDFLQSARDLLSPEGLLVLSAPPARTYAGPALGDLLACYAGTLESVFPHLRAVPADELTLWLASPERVLDLDAGQLVRRWEEEGLDTRVLGAAYLTYLLDEQALAAFDRTVEDHQRVEINRDGRPAGLRYGLAYESALLSPGQEPFFRALNSLSWGPLALGIGLLGGLAVLLVRRRGIVLALAIASTGLAGMTADLLIIFAFQVLYGYVYRQVGLLITAFMAGLSVGGLLMTRWAGRLRCPWRTLAWLEGGLAVGCAGLAAGLDFLLGRSAAAAPSGHFLLLAMNGLMGLLVGLEFPLASHLSAQGRSGEGRAAGFLYAYDLAGATVGAVAVSAVLLPSLGLVHTALLVVLLKAGSALVVAKILAGQR